jgi:hypothetical protein
MVMSLPGSVCATCKGHNKTQQQMCKPCLGTGQTMQHVGSKLECLMVVKNNVDGVEDQLRTFELQRDVAQLVRLTSIFCYESDGSHDKARRAYAIPTGEERLPAFLESKHGMSKQEQEHKKAVHSKRTIVPRELQAVFAMARRYIRASFLKYAWIQVRDMWLEGNGTPFTLVCESKDIGSTFCPFTNTDSEDGTRVYFEFKDKTVYLKCPHNVQSREETALHGGAYSAIGRD